MVLFGHAMVNIGSKICYDLYHHVHGMLCMHEHRILLRNAPMDGRCHLLWEETFLISGGSPKPLEKNPSLSPLDYHNANHDTIKVQIITSDSLGSSEKKIWKRSMHWRRKCVFQACEA